MGIPAPLGFAQLELARDWPGENDQERYHGCAILRGSVEVLADTFRGSRCYDLEYALGERRSNPPSVSAAAEGLFPALTEAGSLVAP